MDVNELIEKLSTYDGEDTVVIHSFGEDWSLSVDNDGVDKVILIAEDVV